MVGAFTISEINYLALGLCCDFVQPLFSLYCGVKFFGYDIFALFPA